MNSVKTVNSVKYSKANDFSMYSCSVWLNGIIWERGRLVTCLNKLAEVAVCAIGGPERTGIIEAFGVIFGLAHSFRKHDCR